MAKEGQILGSEAALGKKGQVALVAFDVGRREEPLADRRSLEHTPREVVDLSSLVPKAQALVPPSSAAIVSSSASRVGLPERP